MKNTLPLSSFPLQALLSFEGVYQPLESLSSGLLLLFKTYSLPYTSSASAIEVVIQVIFFIVMMARIKVGRIANKTENASKILIFFGLVPLCILGAFYFIFWQNYVLLIEVILNAIILLILVIELIIAFTCFWVFKNYEKQN